MTVPYLYPSVSQLAASGFVYTTSTIKCALLGQSYASASPGEQTYLSEVQSHEISGAGYTAGGVTVTGKTLVRSGRTTRLGADNPSWASLTATIRFAVFYISTGTSATSSLLTCMDFETAKSPSAQLFTVVIPAAGLISLQAV